MNDLKLTPEERAKLEAMVREADDKVNQIMQMFGPENREFFLLCLALAGLGERYVMAKRGTAFMLDRVAEWIAVGEPAHTFTGDEINEALIKRALAQENP